MDSLPTIAAVQGGVFLTRQALACGFGENEIAVSVRSGDWIRLRRGAYATRHARAAHSGSTGLHLLRLRAVLLALEGPCTVSHISAAVLRGWPMHQAPLNLVHVTRPQSRTARTEGGVSHHGGRLDLHEAEHADGACVTTAARTVLDVARTCGFETALVIADAAMYGGVSKRDLLTTLEPMRDWHGARQAGRVVEMADAGAESVGESLMRIAFDSGGLPRPLLQVEFRDSYGTLWARVDALFEDERTIVEFDGRVKYDDLAVLFKEKQREDRLRELGYEVVRVIWADLNDPAGLALRVNAAFARARRRHAA